MTTPIYQLLPALVAWWCAAGVAWAGYDEYMTCGSGNERYGRGFRTRPDLPCDLSKQSWCESAGTEYPWSSVRRFVYENQGLMKRMYGNQRHYNVLRAEHLNELYEEMFEEMPSRHHQRYRPSSSGSGRTREPRYQSTSSSNSLRSSGTKTSTGARHSSRAMKITAEPEYHKTKNPGESTTPKSRTKATKARVNSTTSTATTSGTKGTLPDVTTTPEGTSPGGTVTTIFPQSTLPMDETGDTTITTTEEDILTTAVDPWNDETESSVAATPTREYLYAEEDTQATLLPPEHRLGVDPLQDEMWTILPVHSTDSDSLSTSSYISPTHSPEEDSSYTSTETSTSLPSTARSDVPLDEGDYFEEEFISTPLDDDDMTTFTLGDGIVEGAEEDHSERADITRDQIDFDIEEALAEESVQNTGKETEKVKAADGAVKEEEEEVLEVELREQLEGDLVLDSMVVEAPEEATTAPPKIKRPIRGMNACPVKEEFVAPYWANNTRGETRALLNLYPFEQYVQWERCMYEHRQMYCRAGCRCEQQYRLHKLLAFDPSNECRGIFSDWFRFPSCCVCKCYDLPRDLFMGSSRRRPRIQNEELQDEDEDDGFFSEEEEEEDPEENHPNFGKEKIRSRSNQPLANIPPQRRPRLPPRPYSHISPPSNNLVAPPPPPPPPPPRPQFPTSRNVKAKRISTESPEVSTLGTVDAATPHYFSNISNHARVLFAQAQPLPLSRLPRSEPDV